MRKSIILDDSRARALLNSLCAAKAMQEANHESA
jgi:hypothetical protein